MAIPLELGSRIALYTPPKTRMKYNEPYNGGLEDVCPFPNGCCAGCMFVIEVINPKQPFFYALQQQASNKSAADCHWPASSPGTPTNRWPLVHAQSLMVPGVWEEDFPGNGGFHTPENSHFWTPPKLEAWVTRCFSSSFCVFWVFRKPSRSFFGSKYNRKAKRKQDMKQYLGGSSLSSPGMVLNLVRCIYEEANLESRPETNSTTAHQSHPHYKKRRTRRTMRGRKNWRHPRLWRFGCG